jgi:hypothetical protein
VVFSQNCKTISKNCRCVADWRRRWQVLGIRAISRFTGLNQETVLNVLEVAGQKAARLLDDKIRNVKVVNAEIDELHAFVFSRKDHSPVPDGERGEFYSYLSIDRDSKLILNSLVGKRNGENCYEFLQDLKQRIAGRFQLSSDGFLGYVGHNGAVFRTFGNEIDYGTEVKTFAPDLKRERWRNWRFQPLVCNVVRRTAKIGNPDLAQTNTSRVERLNLSVRLFNRRFTRLTLGYSKKLANLKHSLALFIAHYNFCRVHSAHKKTPAQASGLTDHVWTIEEIISETN